jgi:hypothetical protein
MTALIREGGTSSARSCSAAHRGSAAGRRARTRARVRKYRPGSHRTAAYRLADGGGLLLSLTASRQVFPRDRQVVPSLRQLGSREQLGGLVPPGVYAAVTYQQTAMFAVAVPPARSEDPLRVLAWRVVDTRATTSGP